MFDVCLLAVSFHGFVPFLMHKKVYLRSVILSNKTGYTFVSDQC